MRTGRDGPLEISRQTDRLAGKPGDIGILEPKVAMRIERKIVRQRTGEHHAVDTACRRARDHVNNDTQVHCGTKHLQEGLVGLDAFLVRAAPLRTAATPRTSRTRLDPPRGLHQ